MERAAAKATALISVYQHLAQGVKPILSAAERLTWLGFFMLLQLGLL